MGDTPTLQTSIYDEIKSRTKEADESVPYHYGEGGMNSKYRYFTRTFEGRGMVAHYRISNVNKEELLLDENAIAIGHEHCDITGVRTSHNHK